MRDHYDVVVIGGGSTGGVVAARLSDDARCSVLLLEAGPDFPEEASRPPLFFLGGSHPRQWDPPMPEIDWGYRSEPLRNGRRIPLMRGKLVGGSSMINGCVAVRGRPEDFARWVDAGATGWGWADVRPFYEAVEREVTIIRYPPELWLPLQRSAVTGWQEAGFRYVEDMNAPDAWDGVVGPWPRNRRHELRLGTLVTYVRKARGRPNFAIRDRALVDRVVIRDGRARGVSYIDADGRQQEVGADRVVVSAGAYGSPPIVMRSGIGDAAALRALGIAPLADLPVGENLMEHPTYQFHVRTGREHAAMGWPTLAVVARGPGYWCIPAPVGEQAGTTGLICCLGLVEGPPGSVRLASADPEAAPLIDHGYQSVIDAGGFDRVHEDVRRLLATPTYRALGARDLGEDIPLAERLQAGMGSGTHAAGGCSIGAVVDPDLNVYGVEGLTVADASVFPRHVTNNPNLTCYMVGEYLAAKLGAPSSPVSAGREGLAATAASNRGE